MEVAQLHMPGNSRGHCCNVPLAFKNGAQRFYRDKDVGIIPRELDFSFGIGFFFGNWVFFGNCIFLWELKIRAPNQQQNPCIRHGFRRQAGAPRRGPCSGHALPPRPRTYMRACVYTRAHIRTRAHIYARGRIYARVRSFVFSSYTCSRHLFLL